MTKPRPDGREREHVAAGILAQAGPAPRGAGQDQQDGDVPEGAKQRDRHAAAGTRSGSGTPGVQLIVALTSQKLR